jgi:capsular exopolysaccharide synthesis family protein
LRFLKFLRRFWWIPTLTFLLAVGGVVSYFVYWNEPTYVSIARVWETEKLNLPGGAAFSADVQSYLGTQLELLKSGTLWQRALNVLQAKGTNAANAIPRDKDGKPLKVELKMVQAPKSSVFAIQASSSNPEYVKAFLDELLDQYFTYKKEIRKRLSGDTLTSISQQIVNLERERNASQADLDEFQRTNNLAILQQEGAVAGAHLATLKTRLSDLQLESQLLDATAAEQDAAAAGTTNASMALAEAMQRTASTPSRAPTSDRLTPFQEVALLKAQREKLSKFLRPKHPKIVKLDADIEKSQKLIDIYHSQSRDELAANRQALKLRIDSVGASITNWQSTVVEANAKIAEAERLRANVTRNQNTYDRLAALLQNVNISGNIEQEDMAVLESASLAERSYKKELILLALAIVVGLGFGSGIVYLIEARDDRLTSVLEITEKLPNDVVGQVPELPGTRRRAPIPLLEENDERHMFAESYRSLRSALLFLPVEGEHPKIILVTSAVPNEGKSTIAANLARTLAEGGAKVLLVDADLRKGRLHDVLGMQRQPGLAELIQQPADLDKIVQTNSISNLSFISRGSNLGPPGKLFLGFGLASLLMRWRKEYDYVIIDSCPIFAADDATTLAPKVDGTLFVVRSRFSSAKCVREALDLLAQRQAKVLGIIYNRAETSSRSHYYYKYADYYKNGDK